MTPTRNAILTHSGRLVGPGEGHPSLYDIARGLSRQPRFGGQTREPWTVLDHSLYCDELVKRETMVVTVGGDDEEARRHMRLAVLLHDAHEAITGDIPRPLKSESMRLLQRSLDAAIMGAFFPGGAARYDQLASFVHRIDDRALRAEAQVTLDHHPRDRVTALFGSPEDADVRVLRDFRAGKYAPAHYVERVVSLL